MPNINKFLKEKKYINCPVTHQLIEDPDQKVCPVCLNVKDDKDFSFDGNCKNCHYFSLTRCDECNNIYNKHNDRSCYHCEKVWKKRMEEEEERKEFHLKIVETGLNPICENCMREEIVCSLHCLQCIKRQKKYPYGFCGNHD